MTPQEIEALKSERDALAARVEVMKATIKNVIFKAGIVSNICYNIGQQHNESKQILQAVSEYDAARRRFNDLISLDAQQCLRDAQAEAGRAGFVAGFNESGEGFNGEYGASERRIHQLADEYAESVRQGGAE